MNPATNGESSEQASGQEPSGDPVALHPTTREIPDSSTAADVSGRQKLRTHVSNAVERYQKLLEFGLPKSPPKGLSTGFSLLDGMCHGLEPGRVYVIASRPSLGKTTLLLNIIAAVCLNVSPRASAV